MFISILATIEYYVYILATINDTILSWGDLGDDWYHMHIESCLGSIAYIRVYMNMCIGDWCELWDYVNWWLCALVKLGELCEFGDLVNHMNLWLVKYVT